TAWDSKTGLHHFPPPDRARDDMSEHLVGPTGTLYTYTCMHIPKANKSYLIGFADFGGSVRLLGRILSDAEPRIGGHITIVPANPEDLCAGYGFEMTELPDV